MQINTDTDKQTFYQYVGERMSFTDFNTLYQRLGFTKRKTTSLLYNPCKIDLALMEQLSKILNEDLRKVIDRFEIGYDVFTARKYRELTQLNESKQVN
ncbi:hypothetical protein [Aureispira anguillae]|uniref:Uncharacterized protein n=1 Tax=Aureispira anguillae TaxID=2864201 RepID=A0A915YG08_9BACT|nr:hypothetical protein [Aureispira anguillae]BDS12316.1 hypothetical protein AsAng_0030370 [Aureispira anguillae]